MTFVEPRGFEPRTFCLQNRHSTKLSYGPKSSQATFRRGFVDRIYLLDSVAQGGLEPHSVGFYRPASLIPGVYAEMFNCNRCLIVAQVSRPVKSRGDDRV